MTPDEHLDRLNAELDRFQSEHPNRPGTLRLTSTNLRSCSKWKWQQHGWALSDGQVCDIMNGSDKEQRAVLLSILKERLIHTIVFTAAADVLDIVPDA